MLRGPCRVGGFAALFATLWLLGAAGAALANGNVSVGGVTPGGDVKINGDGGNNDVTVTQNGNGTVTVTGNGGTTVNGGASHTTPTAVTGGVSVNTRGGDDTVTVTGVTAVEDITVKDDIGTNNVTVTGSRASDKLKIKNSAGGVTVTDTGWGRRDIRPGTGTLNPRSISGTGGAGSVGTPPPVPPTPTPTPPGGGKKAAGSKKAGKAAMDAQKAGLPTSNPGPTRGRRAGCAQPSRWQPRFAPSEDPAELLAANGGPPGAATGSAAASRSGPGTRAGDDAGP